MNVPRRTISDDPEQLHARNEGAHLGWFIFVLMALFVLVFGAIVASELISNFRSRARNAWQSVRMEVRAGLAGVWFWLTTPAQCAWCKRLTRIPWILRKGAKCTHGMCPECFRTFHRQPEPAEPAKCPDCGASHADNTKCIYPVYQVTEPTELSLQQQGRAARAYQDFSTADDADFTDGGFIKQKGDQ